MRNIDEDTITPAVLAAMAKCGNDRLLTVMNSLVRHLHAFARDVRLTEEEWHQAIGFLTDVGHITDDRRQEFVLLSDVLGLSMLVTAQNNRKPATCTEATVLGPFFVNGSPGYENGEDLSNGAKGRPCLVSGRVIGLQGEPVAGAELEVWQSDEDGFYDVQYGDPQEAGSGHQARGHLRTLPDGRFHFRSILPEAYPIPHDGPVGRLLDALGRHPWRPAHLHFWIKAPGYEPLITHLFRNEDQYLDSDAVFGVRSSLVVDWVEHPPGIAPDGTEMTSVFHTLDYEFVLNPVRQGQ
ncbi:intradiol ring-cleavage dioxygenase [Cupriavidus basilensis]|uniref:Intradiol ring-cleavage dioxygenase n=1 Tax=Cupriavidus basilensis TaxID=68895 RepID=A0A643FZF6_9BURK|nr:intradiol ring-cleavage dioxygenase [Cupriavidus basilensis]QOT81955.1 intradiol ring-cleavage dioxygenase [Cupriavidus basilensis]